MVILTCESIFHRVVNLFKFDCEITFEYVPETNQYLVMSEKGFAKGNNIYDNTSDAMNIYKRVAGLNDLHETECHID